MAGRADVAPLPPGLDDYRLGDSFDEALEAPGVPREHYAGLLGALAGTDLEALQEEVCEEVAARGVTFGADAGPFRLDAIPRVMPADEWTTLKRGLAQRMRALGAFLADLHGPRAIVAAGRIPARVLETAESQEPDTAEAAEVRAWAPVAGLDVVRGADGRFEVLEDNLRTPSGLAYAAEARQVLLRRLGVEPPPLREIAEPAVALLGDALRAAAPPGDGDPAIVLLSDGPVNSAWFEHDWMATRLGVPLVLLTDLEVSGGALFRRDEDGGRHPVDVVYRRTDEDRLTGADGELTPVGAVLAEPWRRGRVACVNAFGTGVADDKLVHAYVEEMVRFYLDEEPLVRSVPTYDLAEPGPRAEALERLEEMVVKPRLGHGGIGVVVCAHAKRADVERVREEIRRRPERLVAQELVCLSTHPTISDGRLEPRHVDLRPFVLTAGTDVRVVPGGLTRVALASRALVVNSSQRGGAKDTWVLA